MFCVELRQQKLLVSVNPIQYDTLIAGSVAKNIEKKVKKCQHLLLKTSNIKIF